MLFKLAHNGLQLEKLAVSRLKLFASKEFDTNYKAQLITDPPIFSR
jgi:hypothetical protein